MITRADLDYLPVAIRAADRKPTSLVLWVEAIRAQRAIIDAADELANRGVIREAGAAQIQAYVGRIADYAVMPATAYVVEQSALLKSRVMELISKA
jgi:hypothetical protein